MTRIASILITIVAAALAGCVFTTANFSEIHLAKALTSDGKPAVKTKDFTKGDPVLFCTAKVLNVPSDPKIKAVWSYLPEGEAPEPIDSAEIAISEDRWVYFSLTPSGAGLPYGQYAVDLSISGTKTQRVTFPIRRGVDAAPVAEAVLARKVSESKAPEEVTATFKTTDPVIYAPVYLEGAAPGTNVTAVWYNQTAQGREEIVRTDVAFEGDGWIAFSLTSGGTFPTATCSVDILVNAAVKTSLQFTIE